MTNPWNLTPGMLEALDSYIEHGSDRAVAQILFKSESTITEQLRMARNRMGAKTRIHMALMFDRWKREQERQAA